MSEERELLKRVRDALRELKETHYDLYWDIQTALDQPEQEPVAWMQDDIELYVQEEKDIVRGYVIPLYLAPPKREPLSDEEIYTRCCAMDSSYTCIFIDGVEWAEHQHGIRSFDDE